METLFREITGRRFLTPNSATRFEMPDISGDESAISARGRPPRHLSQNDLDLRGPSKLEKLNFQGERLRGGLERADLVRASRRVPEDGDVLSPGRDLPEEVEQFPGQSGLIHEQARDVAAGPREARNESALDGIAFEVDSHDGNGGLLFLDEFAEMTPEMQTKLLKVLEGGEFRRVGGVRTITVNVRVLAATNRDLDELVRAGRLREDLLHRVDVIRHRRCPRSASVRTTCPASSSTSWRSTGGAVSAPRP